MRVKLHLIAEIDVDPLPTQDPVELARINLNAMRDAVQPSTEFGVTLYEDGEQKPDLFEVEERPDGVTIMRQQAQEEIDEHIANDEFQCHKCNEWADIEDSIEYRENYYCNNCCVKASCGCLVPEHFLIHDDRPSGTVTCCETCFDRIK